jgi:hypothetical protein
MKRWIVLTIASLALGGVGLAQEKPNLSGTWVLDKERSDPPGMGMGGRGGITPDITLIIEHQEPVLKIKRIIKTERGEQVQELVYTTNGKENKNPGMRGGEFRSKTRWDKGKLVTKGTQTIESPMGTIDLEITETRTLSGDGKTLVIETRTVTPQGERTRRQVFVKRE